MTSPSGRLPVTFPRNEKQLPEGGRADAKADRTNVAYTEGSNVGYRWFELEGTKPLFAFGHGLTYTRFGYTKLRVTAGKPVKVSFTLTNLGRRFGTAVPQIYVSLPVGEAISSRRLAGWKRVALRPGEANGLLSHSIRMRLRFGMWSASVGRCRRATIASYSGHQQRMIASTRTCECERPYGRPRSKSWSA